VDAGAEGIRSSVAAAVLFSLPLRRWHTSLSWLRSDKKMAPWAVGILTVPTDDRKVASRASNGLEYWKARIVENQRTHMRRFHDM
jgi:hypothetical protein